MPAGTYTLSIPEAAPNDATVGYLDITEAVSINGAAGARATVVRGRAGFNNRIFQNTATATTISGIAITGGNAGADGGAAYGGGVKNSSGDLTLREVTVDNNAASSGGGVDLSGGSMTVERSTIRNNGATNGGGAIQNAGTRLTIANSTVTGNTASFGGAMDDDGGKTTITNSTIAFNRQRGRGGRKEHRTGSPPWWVDRQTEANPEKGDAHINGGRISKS